MFVQESYVQRREDGTTWDSGDSGEYEPFTDDLGRLFRSCQREYGRCVGKVYAEQEDGPGIPIGWVFEKRRQFTDCAETYMAETWVTILARPTETVQQRYPLNIETRQEV